MTNETTNVNKQPAVIMPTTPVVSESDLEAALKVAERNELLARKIKTLALKQTNPKDWADMDGKPYLQASGAEKIARLFGISWRICEGYPQRDDQKDDKGSYYVYTYKGEFEMCGKTIEVIGTCSQRDKFFGRKGGELKNESEIDVTNIIRKAMTNMEVNGITRMLGIRNLTWEELAEAGLKQDQSAQVNYKTKAGETEEVEGTVQALTAKSGAKNGKAWKLYNITVNNILMTTFDTKLGEAAAEAKKTGQLVHITYKNNGKGNNVETLEIVHVEEPQADEADYE